MTADGDVPGFELAGLDHPDSGVDLIAAERARQLYDLKWTPKHDAEHDSGQLLDAALCYLACVRDERLDQSPFWPWDRAYWKPSTPTRMLVKAGALIAAEIDRRIAAGEK